MEYEETEVAPVPLTEAEASILGSMADYLSADAARREKLRLEWRLRRELPANATARRIATRAADLADEDES